MRLQFPTVHIHSRSHLNFSLLILVAVLPSSNFAALYTGQEAASVLLVKSLQPSSGGKNSVSCFTGLLIQATSQSR